MCVCGGGGGLAPFFLKPPVRPPMVGKEQPAWNLHYLHQFLHQIRNAVKPDELLRVTGPTLQY